LRTLSETLETLTIPGLLPSEANKLQRTAARSIALLWQGDERRDRLHRHGRGAHRALFLRGHYLQADPQIYEELERGLAEVFPTVKFRIPPSCAMAPGSAADRDGNPFVTLAMTEEALRAMKETALKQYNVAIDELYHHLDPSHHPRHGQRRTAETSPRPQAGPRR
jgi:phosphoenolpyruvate carboxylase